MTKIEMRDVVADLAQAEIAALLRAEAGKPFSGREIVKKLREKELLEPGKWEPSTKGRHVVGFLVGIPYKEPITTVQDPAGPRMETSPGVPGPPISMGKPSQRPGPAAKKEFPEDAVRAVAHRFSICFECREDIPKGTPVLWIEGKGMFHENCVQE